MRKSRFSESQIISILKEAENGHQVKDLCREHGISTACFCQWESKYGGLEAQGVGLKHIQPGKPQQNAYVERYNRTISYYWLNHYLLSTPT